MMTEAATVISMLNDTAVSVFGGVLSASFCSALRSRRNRWIFWLGMALMLIPQGMVYFLLGEEFRRQIYPLALHLPLTLLLYVLTGKLLWPVIAILSAYLSCQIRRWFALLLVAVLPGGEVAQMLAELAITLPLLAFLLRFVAPAVRQIMDYPVKVQCQFGLIPAMYYAFDYLTRIYTHLLSGGEPVVLEFMPFLCCAAYLMFLLHNSEEERERQQMRQIQSNLDLQLSQAVREITQLRDSQAQAIRYRHDLRHHLQYLLSCIENEQTERAKGYISGICAEIEAQRVRCYCENEAVNLILSAFVKRAEEAGIEVEVQGALPAAVPILDSDLCVLLSNALENALHACQPLAAEGKRCIIELQFRFVEKSGRLFLRLANPCGEPARFEKGVPVTDRPGHGIGVQSIRAIVERYGGGCQFLVEDGRFVLRLYL